MIVLLCTNATSCLVSIPELSEGGEGVGDGGSDVDVDVAAEAGWEASDSDADATLPEADAPEEPEQEADAPSCETGTVDCDGDLSNGCQDLLTDGLNCGKCGHDCLGGECVAGVCSAVLLASGIQKPYAIAIDADYVFGTGDDADGQVWKVPVGGCTTPGNCASFVSTAGARYHDIALDADYVYFTDRSADRVARIRKTGTSECTIAGGQQAPVGIAVDANYVYWGAQSGNAIWRASKECGGATPPEKIVSVAPSPQILRLDATGLYWTSAAGGLVTWASLDGASSEPIWSGTTLGDFMFGLAMDDEWVYWRDGYQYHYSGTGRVARARKDRTGSMEVLASDQPSPRYMALDDTHVYWTSNESVGRVAKDGTGEVETLAQGYPSAHGILVEGPAIFFCTYSGGSLYKLAK